MPYQRPIILLGLWLDYCAFSFMKKLFLIPFFSFAFTFIFAGNDITEKVSAAIREGNAKELSKFFKDNVDLAIGDKEEVYSSSQAELILKDFFSKNAPKTFTIVHQGMSKLGLQYVIGNLVTSNGNFRVSFYIKKSLHGQFIQQFRIDTEQ